MSKQFWGVLIVIVLIFAGVVIATNHKKGDSGNVTNAKPTEHIEGQGKSGVKLVEYGDYQCPVCGTFYAPTKQVVDKYMDQIYFQFRNLPLTSLHPNAFAAARAAEAAGMQGKYFQMHDLLYENQNAWAQSSDPGQFFDSYAQQLGLNVSQFDKDRNSAQVNNAINADLAAFDKTGDEKATPTFYLDGKKLDNSKLIDNTGVSVDKFSQIIQNEINQKTKSASGSSTKQ